MSLPREMAGGGRGLPYGLGVRNIASACDCHWRPSVATASRRMRRSGVVVRASATADTGIAGCTYSASAGHSRELAASKMVVK
jgi:hypothetical protein